MDILGNDITPLKATTCIVFNDVVPAMPRPTKVTECIKLVHSKASNDMQGVLAPMVIPAFAAHLLEILEMSFVSSDNKCHGLCGQMGHLIGSSGIAKAQMSILWKM